MKCRYNKSKQFRAQVIPVKLNKLLDLVKKIDMKSYLILIKAFLIA